MYLEKEVLMMMKAGEYDPHRIFKAIYHKFPVHYSKVREAIHNAKQR